MSMTLVGKERNEHFSLLGWGHLISLALGYGWKPAGTLDPEADELRMDDLVEATAEQQRQAEERANDATSQAMAKEMEKPFKSLYPHGDDPVMQRYYENAGYRVTA